MLSGKISCDISAKVAGKVYQKDIGLHVCLHPVLDCVCWHPDEGGHDSTSRGRGKVGDCTGCLALLKPRFAPFICCEIYHGCRYGSQNSSCQAPIDIFRTLHFAENRSLCAVEHDGSIMKAEQFSSAQGSYFC